MARVPDEAIRRRSEITAGAWNLYTLYCLHRNAASGLCSPSNETLASEMRCSYTHVSDSKTELVRKGWIKRQGRQRVTLLVGEFPPLKVSQLAGRTSENSELQLRKIPKLGRPNFGKFRTSTSENSESRFPPPTTPYKDLTSISEPEAAAAPAGENDFKNDPVDDDFCEAIIAAKLYPPPLVDLVRAKLAFRCAQEGVQPTKGRFLYWLSSEREEPVQRALPMDLDQTGEVVKVEFQPRTANEVSLGLIHLLSEQLGEQIPQEWFDQVELKAIDPVSQTIHLCTPNQSVKDVVVANYGEVLARCLDALQLRGYSVVWEIESDSSSLTRREAR